MISNAYEKQLFSFIFANPEEKKWALNLYNAINGTNHTNEADMDMNVTDDMVHLSMKDDVSLCCCTRMNLYEYVSTCNPNLPLRDFLHLGRIYESYTSPGKHFNLFSVNIQRIPETRCVCFYSGTESGGEDQWILSLSDAYKKEKRENPSRKSIWEKSGIQHSLEVKVLVLNINVGYNWNLMDLCTPLREYSRFITEVRKNIKQMHNVRNAVDASLDAIDDSFELKPFLMKNRTKVADMCLAEYREDELFYLIFRDGVTYSWAIGRVKYVRIMQKYIPEEDRLAQTVELPVSLVQRILQHISDHPDWSDEEVADALYLYGEYSTFCRPLYLSLRRRK